MIGTPSTWWQDICLIIAAVIPSGILYLAIGFIHDLLVSRRLHRQWDRHYNWPDEIDDDWQDD